MPNDPYVKFEPLVEWVNHHANIHVPIAARVRISNQNPSRPSMAGMAKTAARIQGVIASAVSQQVRIRACGAHWSYSDIPVVEDGWIVETDQLGWRFFVDHSDIDPGFRGAADELFLVQCGVKIAKINESLEKPAKRRALRTSGASNGQTIGGSLGTGIHGSAIDVGGIESQVAGLQLLTATQNLWIERASAPAMNASFPAKLGATLVRNDQLFEAAIVSLGALGIIHSVAIKTTGRYLLNSALKHIPYSQIQRALNTLDFTGAGMPDETRRPYSLQVILDPDRMDIAYTTVRYKEACPPNYVPTYAPSTPAKAGTDIPSLIGDAIKMFPDLRDTAVRIAMMLALRGRKDDPDEWETPGQVYGFTTARKGVASSGFAVPIAQTTRALETARRAFLEHPSAPVVLTCRFTAKSPGLLSFTRYDPTCVIDVDGIDIPASQSLIALVADRLEEAGIPFTMHWGKMNTINAARVRSGYGGAIEKWNEARRRLLPNQSERTVFSTPFLDGLGLNA